MPLQNRVTPFGDIVAASWRGSWTGNRGCLHDADGRLGARRWRHQNWVCCRLSFRGRSRDPMPPGRWTALFFWDEAVALTAGHRPCGECRHDDYRRFMAAWSAAGLVPGGPKAVDKALHGARVRRTREQIRHEAKAADLPDGVFAVASERPEAACQLRDGRLWHLDEKEGRYRDAGLAPYRLTVLTPRPMVEVITAGYAPQTTLLHPPR